MRGLGSAGALKLAAAVMVVCAALAGGGRSAAAEGLRYEPAGGGFSVTFPAAPKKHSMEELLGAFVLHSSAYGLDHEGMGYFVSRSGGLPAQVMADPRMEELLFTQMETAFARLGQAVGPEAFSVAERSDVKLGNFKGRQCVFNGPNAMGVVRGYKVGQLFYTVGVFGDKAGFSAQRAVAFLDSFKLTGKKQ